MPDFMIQDTGNSILIGSGGTGTCLRRIRGASDGPVELLNIRAPDDVKTLHESYRDAGSNIIVTNTFAANQTAFADAGVKDLCEEVNMAGVALARSAAGKERRVWASVGPLGLGLRLEDYTDAALYDIYRSQCEALKEADALLLETFVEPREACAALRAAVESGLPVVFQIGNTGAGPGRWKRIDTLIAEATRAGVAALGTNCNHPEEIARLISYIAGQTNLPLTASPNAGNPKIERGLVRYEFEPASFAAAAEALFEAGVSVIGGCCGTTPEHIKALATAFRNRLIKTRTVGKVTVSSASDKPDLPARAPNMVRSMMESSRFIVSVEIRADRAQSLDMIVSGASIVAEAGADMFDVPDNPGATVGRDAIITAARLQNSLGIPSICHVAVTHSNLMRLHSSLIGCWDSGLRGILAVTGDAPSMGHLGALVHRVADVRSSVELLRLTRKLRSGTLVNGDGLADPPDFCAGCAVAGSATPAQIRWLKAKIDAGAEFVFSQPVFTINDYKRLRDALTESGIRLFPGVMPIAGKRNALFLAAGRIPGITVPDAIVEGFEKYSAPEDQRKFGLDRARELVSGITADAKGIYLIMPFGKSAYEDAASIVKLAKSITKQ